VPSLYFAKERPVVERVGALILVGDDRLPLRDGETPLMKKARFRTLGCYPLTGAIESEAETLEAVIAEMLVSTTSERQGRVIDHDPSASMEKKKQEGVLLMRFFTEPCGSGHGRSHKRCFLGGSAAMNRIENAGAQIADYLQQHEIKGLLRFITCGSVDDGRAR
jgi:hypothetical protein